MQNFHRYGLLLSAIFLVFLWYDAMLGFRFADSAGVRHFGVGVGSLVMLLNVVLLSGYTFGCHSMRHILGGLLDQISKAPLRKLAYDASTVCNRSHMKWAWASLISVASTDVYIRLCSMGIIADLRLF
jgi:hypothetical protein